MSDTVSLSVCPHPLTPSPFGPHPLTPSPLGPHPLTPSLPCGEGERSSGIGSPSPGGRGGQGVRTTVRGECSLTPGHGPGVNTTVGRIDLLDYLVAKARERGIYMLFSPIQLYGSNWPDALGDTTEPGFGRHFGKAKMGTDSLALAAQVNYLHQILNHVNPYTKVALKDEPAILFVELVNEPWHHSEDIPGSVRYINALTDAVRATACKTLA